MEIHQIIKSKFDQLERLCKQFKVDKLYAFGSVVNGKFDESTSDIDLIVILEPMDPLKKGETLLRLWTALEDLFKKKVDLLTDKPIQNPYFKKQVEATKKLIYDRRNEEILV